MLARLVGYRPIRVIVRLKGADTVRTDIRLVRQAVQLDPIVVTESPKRPRGIGLEGLEERRLLGFGRFIDSTVLRKSEGLDLITVARRAGIEVNNGGYAIGRSRCPMTVYLDGISLKGAVPLRMFTVFGLTAVEAYASVAKIPAAYDALDQTCGVLLLWTRK